MRGRRSDSDGRDHACFSRARVSTPIVSVAAEFDQVRVESTTADDASYTATVTRFVIDALVDWESSGCPFGSVVLPVTACLELPAAKAGTETNCPHCGSSITVPTA